VKLPASLPGHLFRPAISRPDPAIFLLVSGNFFAALVYDGKATKGVAIIRF
jgi:hypothetical protein